MCTGLVYLQVHDYVRARVSADFPMLNQMGDHPPSTSEEKHHQMRTSNAAHMYLFSFLNLMNLPDDVSAEAQWRLHYHSTSLMNAHKTSALVFKHRNNDDDN